MAHFFLSLLKNNIKEKIKIIRFLLNWENKGTVGVVVGVVGEVSVGVSVGVNVGVGVQVGAVRVK